MIKKLWILAFFSCSAPNLFALTPNQADNPPLEACKEKLAILKTIADESCRTVPDRIISGSGYPQQLLHSYVCENASNKVISQAKSCLMIAESPGPSA